MLGLILPTSRYRPWPDAFATASDILYRDVPSVVVMRSNIVNRLSASHYYKHNCLHVFQWFRLTLLLRKCGSKCVNCLQLAIKSSLIARGGIGLPRYCLRYCSPPLLRTPMPLIWVVPPGWYERNDIVLPQPNRSSQATPRSCKTNDARSDDTGVGGSLSHGVI